MEEIIQALEAQKAQLEQQLERIDRMLALAGGGEVRGARGVGRPKGQSGRKAKGGKGALKEDIVAEIKAAGSNGISSKDIAAKIGVPSSRLGTWFATTGKKVNEIKRLDRGFYCWKDNSPDPVESQKAEQNPEESPISGVTESPKEPQRARKSRKKRKK